MTKICIVIPTFNRAAFLERLLTLIRQQELNGIVLHTTVAVDGSTDGTYEMLAAKFPEAAVVRGDGNWWFTRSLNEGCQRAAQENPDFFLLLNDDCEIGPDFVQTLFRDHQTVEPDAIIGTITHSITNPDIVTFSGVRKIRWWRYKSYRYHPPFFDASGKQLSGVHPTLFLNARGSLIPSETFRRLNYYDNFFAQYLSDSDFSYRATKAGYPLYISWNARIFDHIDATAAGAPYRKQKFAHYMKQYFNKYSPNYLPFHRMIVRRNVPFLLRPLTMGIYLLGTTKAYFKYKYRYKNR